MKRHKKYAASFKRDSVNLALSSHQPIEKTARDIGIAKSTLQGWVRNHRLGRYVNLSDKSPLSSDENALKKALKELSIVTEERDILKKALGIFSQPRNK